MVQDRETLEWWLAQHISMPLSEIRRQIEMGLCRVGGVVVRSPTFPAIPGINIYLGQTMYFEIPGGICAPEDDEEDPLMAEIEKYPRASIVRLLNHLQGRGYTRHLPIETHEVAKKLYRSPNFGKKSLRILADCLQKVGRIDDAKKWARDVSRNVLKYQVNGS